MQGPWFGRTLLGLRAHEMFANQLQHSYARTAWLVDSQAIEIESIRSHARSCEVRMEGLFVVSFPARAANVQLPN